MLLRLKFLLRITGVCLIYFYSFSLFGQDTPIDSTQNQDSQLNQIQDEVKLFLQEFTDLNLLDHSVQVRHQGKVREIKKMAKQAEKDESVVPVGLTVYSKLHVDELWARWLTGKWKYTEEGKQDTNYLIKGNGIDLSFRFDTLEDRNHFKVTPTAKLNDLFIATLEGLQFNPDTVQDTLNLVLVDLFNGTHERMEKPNMANIDAVVEQFYHKVNDYMHRIWGAILESTQELKELYDDQNVQQIAQNLDQAITQNQNGGPPVYVLDADQKKFKNSIYEHFNTQLAEIGAHYSNPIYIVYFETDYVYNQTEIASLAERIYLKSKKATEADISLVIVQSFVNEELAPSTDVTRLISHGGEHPEIYADCNPQKNISSETKIFSILQQVIRKFQDQISDVQKFEKMPVTTMLSTFNHPGDFYNTEHLKQQGYGAFLGHSTIDVDINVWYDKLYTASRIPIKSINGSEFYSYNAFDAISGVSSSGKTYEATYAIMPNRYNDAETGSVQSNPGISFLGFWTRELTEQITRDEFVSLEDVALFASEDRYAKENREYVFAQDGDLIFGGFLNLETCKIEHAQVKQFGEVAARPDGPLRLSGGFQMPHRPDYANAENYNVITTSYLIENEDDEESGNELSCAIQTIYAQNGYGKIFLDRFMPKVNKFQWEVLIEIAQLYDNEDYKLIKELASADKEVTYKDWYLGVWDRTIHLQQDRTIDVLQNKISWDDYLEFVQASLTHFTGSVTSLQAMSDGDEDELAESLLSYFTNYQLVKFVSYDDRLRLLKILAQDGFGNEEDAALKLVGTFSQVDSDRTQFLLALESPNDSDGPAVETLLEVLDEAFYDPHVTGSNDLWHAFASLISSMATETYYEASKLEAQLKEPNNLLNFIYFYEYNETSWGYKVHQYESDFTAEGANELYIEYQTNFQIVKGFTGEALNNLVLVSGSIIPGGIAVTSQIPNAYEVRANFHPLRDFMVVRLGTKTAIYPAYYIRFLSGDKGIKRFTYYQDLVIDGATIALSVATLGMASPLVAAIELASIASAITNATVTVLEDLEILDPKMVKSIKDATMVMDLIGMGVSLPSIIRSIPSGVKAIRELANIKNWKPLIVTDDVSRAARSEQALVEISEDCQKLLDASEELAGVAVSTSKWDAFTHIAQLDPTILAHIDDWAEPLIQHLDEALRIYPELAGELKDELDLLNHFEGLHTNWWYRLGLARAYHVTGAGSINLPENFAEVLKDLEFRPGETIRQGLTTSNPSSEFGKALEAAMDGILENAWNGGISGIQNADIPTDLKQYYEGIYGLGYKGFAKQGKISVPGTNYKPEPDYLFFKTNSDAFGNITLDLSDVIYHDAKISVKSAFSTAQGELLKTLKASSNAVEIEVVRRAEVLVENQSFFLEIGQKITISEISKIGTDVITNQIELIRSEKFLK